jgi:flavin reductase (DIM6/NTAB) family NADH-FMN oxidoreductase RutF
MKSQGTQSVAREGLAASGDYIAAMGQHVASVCVITTEIGGERFGLTATAVSSVCATPPRLLVCVNKSGQTCAKIEEAGRFCVNVLNEDQDGVAKAFAGMLGKTIERFSLAAWTTLKTGAPVLVGAAASFDCEIGGRLDQFTHAIFLGDVVAVSSQLGRESLLYGSRKFRQLRKVFSSLESNSGDTLHF